jgi:mono/diheme cytochrome c family protein
MLRGLLLLLAGVVLAVASPADSKLQLHVDRTSAGDLEVGGDLAGMPAGSTRYIRYEDLLRLPQEIYTVSDDSNFPAKTTIEGVSLEALAHQIGNVPKDLLIVAICYDKYRTNYPSDYLATHHPLLVLRINGQPRDRWPPSEDGGAMGPYLISHPFFKPAFKVLSHQDEPQIPFGAVRIELKTEAEVFGAIRPGAAWRENERVQQGFVIARQDCFRCHNMGTEGGTMAGRSWLKLAGIANADGTRFKKIIHNPASVSADAKMPAHSDYDDATLNALTAYFKTFAGEGKTQ